MVIARKTAPDISPRALDRFTERARKAVGLRGNVHVVLTSSRDIRALNRRFRGHDTATDVLSFPAVPLVADEFSGDIVISTEVAARSARLHRHPTAQEVKILVLHGLLHLAGYDHECDGGEMAREEEKLRRKLGLSNGLIGRTNGMRGSGVRLDNAAKRPAPQKQATARDRRRSR